MNTLRVTVLPAGHGDCVLIQCDGGRFNVLVDSGPTASRIRHRVWERLRTALGERQVIDLAVVTHYDDDHLGGLQRALHENAFKIQDLLFNAPELIAHFIQEQNGEVAVSARQARDVAALHPTYNETVAYAGQEHWFFDNRVELKLLSPFRRDVLKLGKSMLAKLNKEEPAGVRGREIPLCGTVAELLARDDHEQRDTSEANGLSLAFIFKYAGRSLLFLGDSWPSRVSQSLETMLPPEGRLAFDLVMVSHHGSQFNSTVDLYRKIAAFHFVISADGSQNPDVETFSRILRSAEGREITFHLSEDTDALRRMFLGSDLRVKFPAPNQSLYLDL